MPVKLWRYTEMATSKNDITGDNIQSKAPSKAYQDNFDRIFRKTPEEVDQEKAWDDAFESIETYNKLREAEHERTK